MKNKGKILLIPATVLLLAGCGSNPKPYVEPPKVIDDKDESINISTKREAFDYGNKVNSEICEEGMILLKNENNALPLKRGAKVSFLVKTLRI
ncbi:MAG: glycoside hydrolase family 3 C-terminal domain-containing protein [Bacilli bacterium]|nr:glycoside hydrolase family 3 C-terminal domain-containing protein [Bacilli bacterium]